MAKKRGRGARAPEIAAPTPEQMAGGDFELTDIVDKQSNGRTLIIGKGWCRIPMVRKLHRQGLFSEAEYKALMHYRHHADIANRSLVRDSLNKERHGGTGNGPTNEVLNALRVTEACERAAGSLLGILRAVVIDDCSLSNWAIAQNGAVEQCRDRKGKRVCTLEPIRKALEIAKLDMQMAAKRVEAELSA